MPAVDSRRWIAAEVRALCLLAFPVAAAAAQQPARSVRGTVTDSIRHGPLAGATVVATPTVSDATGATRSYTALTDANGRYAIQALPRAVYVLTVEHPWLDSAGLGVPAQRVDLVRQPTAVVDLAVPSGATIRSAYCPIAARDSTIGLVAGYVKDVISELPVPGARVVFAWSDFDVDPQTARVTPRDRTAAVSTGRDGTFRVCGLPVLRTILMQAQVGDRGATGAVELEVPASGVLVETLRVDAGVGGTTSLTGAVRQSATGEAIVGAHVHLFGATADVLTDEDGSFRLSGVPFGTQSVEVTAIGFYPRRYLVDVRSTGMDRVTITMLKLAAVLDSIRIMGQRSGALAVRSEFDDRSTYGAGQYITEQMIARADPLQTTDLLQQVRGFYVMGDAVYSSRGITTLTGSRVCQPALFVDGVPNSGGLNDIAPNAIHGIEIYASSANVPAKYGVAACGAILVWTR
jgi:hypothetical protein